MTLLKQRRDVLGGSDSFVARATQFGSHGGQVSRLMVARLDRFPNIAEASDTPSVSSRSCFNYYKVMEEKDHFPNSSLLEQVDFVQTEKVSSAIEKMLQDAAKGGFTEDISPHSGNMLGRTPKFSAFCFCLAHLPMCPH